MAFEHNSLDGFGDLGKLKIKAPKVKIKTPKLSTSGIANTAKKAVGQVGAQAGRVAKQTTTVVNRATTQVGRAVKQVGAQAGRVAKQATAVINPVVKEVQRAVSKVERNVLRPVVKEVQRLGVKVEQNVLRPVAKQTQRAVSQGSALVSGKPKEEQPPEGWMVYEYIENGRLVDAYGNVSPSGPVAGKSYYNLDGDPVDYKGNPIVVDANSVQLVQVGDKYYFLSNNQEVMIGDDGIARSPEEHRAKYMSDWGQYDYINEKGQLIDAYGNVSPSGPVKGKVYYDLNGQPVDYQGSPVVLDASGKQLVEKDGKYYDIASGAEMMIGEDGNALTVEDYRKAYMPDWGKFDFINEQGKMVDAYGNVSNDAPVAGRAYFDMSGNPIDYQGNAIATDANGTQVIEKDGKYYNLQTGKEVWIDENGIAISPEDFKASRPGWGEYDYMTSDGNAMDAYGNVSPNPPAPGKVYYNAETGEPTDFMQNPVVSDAAGKMLAQFQGRYFDVLTLQEMWIDEETATALTPKEWLDKYYPGYSAQIGLSGFDDAINESYVPIIGLAAAGAAAYYLYKNSGKKKGRR